MNKMCIEGKQRRLRRSGNPSPVNAWFCAREQANDTVETAMPCTCSTGSEHAWSVQEPKSCFTGKRIAVLNYQDMQVETKQKVGDSLTAAVRFYRLRVGHSWLAPKER